MLKTLKRKIALVAVAALGSAGLAVVAAPAAHAAAAGVVLSGDLITRTGTTGADGTITLEVGAAALTNADNETITATLSRNGVNLGTVPAGITIDWDDTRTQATNAGGGEAANNAFSLNFDIANAGIGVDIASIAVAKTTAPGKYVLSISTATTYTDAKALTFYVSGAPATFAWTDTTVTVDAGGTATHELTVNDAAANPTYFLAGEVADINFVTVAGATMPTVDIAVLDSGTRPRTALATTVTVSAGAGVTAGTYSLRAVASTGITVATASTSVVASAAPKPATTVTITDATYLNANGNGDGTLDESTDNVSDAAGRDAYLSTAAKTITFKAATASTSGSIRFTVTAAGAGLPAGITASTGTDVAITGDATNGYSASLTLTALAPAAGYGFTVNTAAAGGTSRGFTVLYQSPLAFKVTTSDPLLDGGTISSVKASKNSMTVKVTDQFGVALANTGVIFTTSARNTTNGGSVTDASGLATYEWTDASTSTTVLSDTVTATVATANPAAGKTGHDGTVSTVVGYVDSVAVGTVTLSGTVDPVDADLLYDTAIAADGTTAMVVKTNDTALVANTATDVSDQARVKAVVKTAAGVVMQGVKVTFTASDGAFFAASANTTKSIVPTVTLAVKTLDVYTDAAGEAYAQVRVTKTGTLSVSASAGGVKETAPVTATVTNAAADARSIATENVSGNAGTGALVKFTVKDGWGNAVSGVNVTFSVTGNGTFLNGTNTTTGTTDTTGVASVSFIGSAAGTATVVGLVTTTSQASAEAAAVTGLGFAKGVKSATSTVTVGAASAVANPAVDAVKTDVSAVKADVKAVSDTVATLSKAVTTIQSSVTELTTSFAAQIKSLSAAIAKISKAIAALSKRIK